MTKTSIPLKSVNAHEDEKLKRVLFYPEKSPCNRLHNPPEAVLKLFLFQVSALRGILLLFICFYDFISSGGCKKSADRIKQVFNLANRD